MNKGTYYYCRRLNTWAVYVWNDEEKTSSSKVSSHLTKEDARKEVYRLNGWEYKEYKNEK